ncbi:MAG TPA: hypothetical protein VGB30_09525 [bacterium]|jgi:hypothetical protein
MADRYTYLESEFKKVPPVKSGQDLDPVEYPLDSNIRYPMLARYDFAGRGPRNGVRYDAHLFQNATNLKTRGENVAPHVKRIGWILIRLAIGFGFMYLVLHGREFDCVSSTWRFT